ncbi:MAG: Fe-S cluster assembly protein SufD [Marinilabiliales bacterium]|nr:MAG: Fe-S cluster assembly protein SufD [Marinilabiliales bacterium]
MSTVTSKISLKDHFISLYREKSGEINSNSSDLMNSFREDAVERFAKTGLPRKGSENYRYADIEGVFGADLEKYFGEKKVNFNIREIFHCDVPDLETNLLLLVNGRFYNNGQMLGKMPGGIIAGSLAQASKEYPDLVRKHYGKYAGDSEDGLVSLNTAFAQDGIFIYVPKGVSVKKPVQVVNIMIAENDLMTQHRNLFIAEEDAEARIVVCDHTLSAHRFLTNSVNEIYTAGGAKLSLTRIQNEHNGSSQVTHTFSRQEGGSEQSAITISLHGGFIRNNVYVRLDGERAENKTMGLYLTDKGQYIDNFVHIDHAAPNCFSNQLYKGVLDDYASGSFNGRILVRRDAQKTNAYQANNNILLTDDAKMYSRPQLEIYADDVKCSHGSTMGQLDENALFYLRSRGIDRREARLLLMFAFTHEVIQNIKVDALRDRIDDLVDKRLRGELSRCNNCAMQCG